MKMATCLCSSLKVSSFFFVSVVGAETSAGSLEEQQNEKDPPCMRER